MKTDYSAPWRFKRFKPNPADAPAVVEIKRIYNMLANKAGADVAARYLATRHSGKNETGLFVELAGPNGAGLMNIFGDTLAAGDSALKASFGIGEDWVCPYIRVLKDRIEVGTPHRRNGQTVGIDVTATYPL